jgi:hypothetical protein
LPYCICYIVVQSNFIVISDFDIIFTSTSVVSLTSAVVNVELKDVSTFTLSGWLQCSTCDAVVTLSNENGEPLMSLKNNNSLVVELSRFVRYVVLKRPLTSGNSEQ